MADTGDGGNSSYTVARLLAPPSLRVRINGSMRKLPRGDMLLSGDDLAYPNPSSFTYEKRLFRPFECALQPPIWYKEEQIAVSKPELKPEVDDLRQYDGPQCFVIPGNHGMNLDHRQNYKPNAIISTIEAMKFHCKCKVILDLFG